MIYTKDVFVSYSSSDLPWVDSELLRRLKDARVAYIEPRDFHPGTMRINQIEKAIASSRRTLLIVSNNYLSDAFAEFANGLALSHALETRTWSVIPVIKEENIKLPIALASLVKSNFVAPTEDDWRAFTGILSSDPPSDNHEERSESGSIGKDPALQIKPALATENHAARNGLTLLVELMSKAEVSNALIDFRMDFEDLCVQMQKLKLLKRLHDKFQELESSVNILFNYAKPDTSGAIWWDAMDSPEIDVTANVQDLIDMASESKFAETTDLWVQRLLRAQVELHEGTSKRKLDSLRAAGRRFSAVLDTLPSRINVQMVTEARALRLSSLERALMAVHEILQNLQPNTVTGSQLDKIEESAKRIDKMDRELKTVLYVHDALQEIDTEVRRIEVSFDDDIRQVIEFWEEVSPKIETICSGILNDWAVKLAFSIAELGRSFPSGRIEPMGGLNEFSETKRKFLLFRNQLTRSFNRVDQDMIRRCNELEAEIQKPLAPLLALLHTI